MARSVVRDRVHRYLLQKLANEEWLPGQWLPSLRAVGQDLHVSHHPVHLVWQQALAEGLIERRGQQTFVAEGARDRAKSLLAETVARTKRRRLAILISAKFSLPLSLFRSPFQAKIAHAVIEAASQSGYETDMVSIDETDQLSQASQIVRKYDAAFSIGLSPRHLIVMTHLAESGLPTLTFQRHVPGLNLPSLLTDEFGAAKRMAKLFANEGHTNVSMVTSLHCDTIIDHRLIPHKGWIEGLREAGIYEQCVMPLVFAGDDDIEQYEKLLSLRPVVTGLLIGVPPRLVKLARTPFFSRLKIPGDISVAATSTMGRLSLPEHYPSITSCEVEWQRLGIGAIEMLDTMMSGRCRPRNIRIPLRIEITESIGPPPARGDI